MAVETTGSRERRATAPGRGRRRWGWAHYFALLGLPILFVEVWTVVAWLADGPYQITEYRGGDDRAFWGARIIEGTFIALALWVISRLIADCRQRRQILTLDVMLCLVGASMFFFVNAGNNVFMPMFGISSEFVNLNDPCGHNPIIVNPDCGRFANPVLFLGLMEAFGLLACAMLLGVIVRKVHARWPHLSNPQLFLVIFAGACLLVMGEPALLLPLHLWSFPGTPISVEIGGEGMRYPLFPEIFVFAVWMAAFAALRIFKDDKGRTLLERGLEDYSPRARKGITLMGIYGAVMTSTWMLATAPMWLLGFNQQGWPEGTPAHIVNGQCDARPDQNTRYGPCPGSENWKMPVRGSTDLPGEAP